MFKKSERLWRGTRWSAEGFSVEGQTLQKDAKTRQYSRALSVAYEAHAYCCVFRLFAQMMGNCYHDFPDNRHAQMMEGDSMPANLHRESAKIYQFPVKFRGRGERLGTRQPLEIDPDICDAAFDSWYHEDAIREAEEKRKPQA